MITARTFWIWFGGTWFAVGLLFLAIAIAVGVNRASIDARLAADGLDTRGVVLGKEIASSGSSRSRTYRVMFRFADERGAAVPGSAELTPEAWDALVELGPIELRYLPSDPAIHRVRGERDTDTVLFLVLGAVGLVLAGVGGVLLLRAVRNLRRQRELERCGVLRATSAE
jgi:hypothetical protein